MVFYETGNELDQSSDLHFVLYFKCLTFVCYRTTMLVWMIHHCLLFFGTNGRTSLLTLKRYSNFTARTLLLYPHTLLLLNNRCCLS